jgi:hypothetical protein
MMKQRAGLGKKVSSIFDGVPLPKPGQEIEQALRRVEPQVPQVPPQVDVLAALRQMPTVPPTPQQRPVPVVAPPTAPVAVPQPPRIVSAPMPREQISEHSFSKNAAGASRSVGNVSGNSLQQLIHKIFFSGNSEIDGRNKKAIAMVGVLSVVLVGVVMWTGVFSGSSGKLVVAGGTVAAANAASGQVRIDWTPPEPYPSSFRDPMQMGSKKNGGSSTASSIGNPIVKSIVYCKNEPNSSTAIMNGEIVRAGQMIGDIKIVKISSDSVEFAANGKNWKQQVE